MSARALSSGLAVLLLGIGVGHDAAADLELHVAAEYEDRCVITMLVSSAPVSER